MSDKKALTKEEIIKNATTFPFPEENVLYHTEVAIQKNVLLIGKAGVGKSTFFEVLKDTNHKTSITYSFFASGPKEPQYTPLVVRNASGRAYSINVIDTPGICEVRSSLKESRSNEQIIKAIQECITASVTHISAVFFMLPIKCINEEDLQTLSIMKGLLGEGFKKNTFLIFTHADAHQLSTLSERLNEFLSSEISLPFLDFCRGGIHFTGAVNGELAAELGASYEKSACSKISCLRQNLCEAIMEAEDVKVDFNVVLRPEPVEEKKIADKKSKK